jgi:DNA (cytosine-5)-methyltransferase 1
MEKTICELFAGVGGFRLGFERASTDWKTVWFSQWEPGRSKQWAHDCYVSHWGDINAFTGIDISLVDKSQIPNHNLLVGGFPCQDYSVARPLPGSTGIQGKKGVLWWQIQNVLREKQPSFVLLENVDRLLKSPAIQRGRDFGVMLACLNELGYQVEWRVINAADYGAAQRRRRVFIFACKRTTRYSKSIAQISEEKILTEDGFFQSAFPVIESKNMGSISISGEDIVNISEIFNFEFRSSGIMRDGKISSCDVIGRKESPIPLKSILVPKAPDKYFLNENLDKWIYLKGAKKIDRISKGGHSYTFSEGHISFPDNSELPARTILTSESSLNRSTHVVMDPEKNMLRLLTPMEAERVQGFDDDWTNTGMPEKFRYFCMGNALVVPMVTRMALVMEEIFNQE